MKKRVSLTIALAMALALMACGNKQNTEELGTSTSGTTTMDAAEDGETEILVWTFLNPDDESGRGKVLRECKEMYESLYPNVKVTIESQQWDTMTAKFFAAAQTGTAPDVIWVNGLDLGEAVQLGVVDLKISFSRIGHLRRFPILTTRVFGMGRRMGSITSSICPQMCTELFIGRIYLKNLVLRLTLPAGSS